MELTRAIGDGGAGAFLLGAGGMKGTVDETPVFVSSIGEGDSMGWPCGSEVGGSGAISSGGSGASPSGGSMNTSLVGVSTTSWPLVAAGV